MKCQIIRKKTKEIDNAVKKERENKAGIKFLRWPWNVIIYIALVLALRIFSIPIIAFLIWLQQKNNPHGIAEGYCLSRTRKRLLWVLWAALLFAISAALGVYFYVEGGQEHFGWQTTDYAKWILSGCMAAFFFAGGVYMGFVGIRDAFFPAKSSLAKSIRSQLSFPEEAPPVEELFAMVDHDLEQDGIWFEGVGIGKEWILGEEANRIERIRGIFTVDEIHHSQTQTGARTSRKLQLVLIDNHWHKSVTDFKNPKELQAAAEYIALLEPDALQGRNSQYLDFLHYDNLKQEEFERNFQQKKNKQELERILNER